MFAGMMKESYMDKVTIHDVEAHIMDSLVKFCYTGNVLITEENVIELLTASSLFQVL